MKIDDDTRFCPGCGTPQQPLQPQPVQPQPVQPQPVQSQPVQPQPVQPAYEAYTVPSGKKKGGKLALILIPVALVLVAAIVCLILFVGGNAVDKALLGRYDAVSCVVSGMELGTDEEWIELKTLGRASLALLGDTYSCRWSLEGEDFTLTQHGDTFTGTLEDGILVIDLGGMVYTYVQQPTEHSEGGHLHEWKEATCLEPRTCGSCGETEGTALGHTAAEANYQDPSVCTACGVQLAGVLEPAMERHGITQFAELGVTYPYTTVCNYNKDFLTVGTATFIENNLFEAYGEWPAVEGYEYRQVVIEIVVSDQNAKSYGTSPDYNIEDYYDIDLLDDSLYYDEEAGCSVYNISYHGELMEVRYWVDYDWSGWHWDSGRGTKIDRCYTTATYLVPVGYDGVVYGVRNGSVVWEDQQHIYDIYTPEDFLLFRLN